MSKCDYKLSYVVFLPLCLPGCIEWVLLDPSCMMPAAILHGADVRSTYTGCCQYLQVAHTTDGSNGSMDQQRVSQHMWLHGSAMSVVAL